MADHKPRHGGIPPAGKPDSQQLAPADARTLVLALKKELDRSNVPSNAYELQGGGAALSLWLNLVARTDGRIIWWDSLRLGARGKPLMSYACTAKGAARRLAVLYLQARERWPADALEVPKSARWEPRRAVSLAAAAVEPLPDTASR
ncbi:hypothetical protein ACOZ38_29515 [Sphaerisporangium viridialbum]|uniref:hypothetical protein n=1 Tax=Sphaerisporangium viridialbum TaxID=46189 RepID=UPI003C77F321